MQNVLSALAVLLILGVGTAAQAETRDGAVTLKATTATTGTGGAADEAAPGKDTATRFAPVPALRTAMR